MQWKSLLSVVLVAPYAHALLRFPCSQLVSERFDPLVTPGQVSPHLHQVIGGNAFNLSMPEPFEGTTATCTTCRFKEDKSNYWTAVLYFKHPNGTFIRVPQMANQYVGAPNGGMTVYYIQPPNNEKVTAFPKGFRMITGNPFLRNSTRGVDPNSAEARAVTFRCWSENFGGPSQGAPGSTGDSVALPNQKCTGGIRSNIYFPSCWDGKNLNPPDHHSHMAYPVGPAPAEGLFFNSAACPSTHPVRVPLILYETAWDTRQFNNMWPTDGSQPFVFSFGDPTGYGHHGDYVFGWENDSLPRAMDSCTDISGVPDNCKVLTVQSDAQINSCRKSVEINEVTEGQYLAKLPGCNPIQNGPAPATIPASCDAISTTGGVSIPTSTTIPSGTTVAPAPTSTTVPQGPMASHYAQCGGQGYSGPTVCQPPYTCKYSNQWYSQCL